MYQRHKVSFIHSGDFYRTSSRDYYSEALPDNDHNEEEEGMEDNDVVDDDDDDNVLM